ncbi:MAG: hypothetical protein ACI85V_001015, partial [bacterium]
MPASQSLSDIWTKWCNVTDLGLVTIKREGPTQIQFWFIA